MKISEILERDPAKFPLVNNGQARIVEDAEENILTELKAELSTFVCEGQFTDGMHRIINSFLKGLTHTSQKGAWVSGFYGSGKSHLLKMLCHLWQNTEFPDGSTARSLVPELPTDIHAVLRELDLAGKREGGLVAAAGTLPSGSSESVRLTILGILLRGVGLPAQYPQARFVLWLRDRGFYDSVKRHVESAGKSFTTELNNLYVSPLIAKAILEVDPDFGADAKEVRATLRQQFPDRVDITTEEFLQTCKQALQLRSTNGKLPCTLLILDEAQQFIADSQERSTLVTEVAEAVSKQLDSHVTIVAAGQSALTGSPLLQKLMDRFTIRIALSDSDVEVVTRKVLLQKNPSAIGAIRKTLDSNAGEVSRQLQGTRIGERSADREVIVDDYPLLPVRRRFWEQCFRVVDAEGTQSQLRSQLRILHDAIAKISNQNLGAIVPGDELYEALAPEMVNKGVLLREINERIISLADGTDDGKLARRICGLVFLIGKLPRESGADIGVRASKEHIADLLVTDLGGENGKLRAEVGRILDTLVDDGSLMRVGDEVRLQTRDGAEWDAEFRRRQAKLRHDTGTIFLKQNQFLYGETDETVRKLKISQGDAKVARGFTIHRDQTPPAEDGDSIVLWVRDGWSTSEKEVVAAARAAGSDSPVVHVFIPKPPSPDLQQKVIDAEAAMQTIDFKGVPSTDEGREAQRGMESRRDLAARERDRIVHEIVSGTKVFQSGGNEILLLNLDARLRDAAEASLVRLFPRFKDADYSVSAWEAVVKRAKEGADQPFQPVRHGGPTEQHPVCQQVITTIGAGRVGSEIQKALKASPFGWPQDAIDAALIALHRQQHITATLNGQPVPLGQLDQNRIKKAELRVEKETLSVQDRLAIRKLFQSMSVQCKPGEELSRAGEFLNGVFSLVREAGGEPPLPEPPGVDWLVELSHLSGNQQLRGILDHSNELTRGIDEWRETTALIGSRKPVWSAVEEMARHARSLPGTEDLLTELEAIREERLLLEASDPCTNLKKKLEQLLREAIRGVDERYGREYERSLETLSANAVWRVLPAGDQVEILREVILGEPKKTDVSNDEALLRALDLHSLDARNAAVDAIAGRVSRAIEIAAKRLEPKVRPVSLSGATLRSKEEVETWIEEQRTRLLDEVKKGPILVKG